MITEYEGLLDWIYSFVNLEAKRTRKLAEEEMKLAKISHLLKSLGNPQQGQRIIHIAGSKGKGSLVFLLDVLLGGKGFKTGLYTSPHLLDVRERIRSNNSLIGVEEFNAGVMRIKSIVEMIEDKALEPTFFDIFTALAFDFFNREKMDIWLVETGLGGRLDSTNVVKPLVSVITSISKEHTEILGKRYRDIAGEKGGIIKEDTPVVLTANRKVVVEVIQGIAAEKNAPLYYLPDFYRYKSLGYTRSSNGEIKQRLKINEHILHTSLLGDYQAENIAFSFLTIRALQEKQFHGFSLNLRLDLESDLAALENLTFKGRFSHYIREGVDIFVDGAHNAEAAAFLAKTVINLQGSSIVVDQDIVGIIGILKDKDYRGILKAIVPLLDYVYFIEPDIWRECQVENYLEIFRRLNSRNIGFTILKADSLDSRWLKGVMEDYRASSRRPFCLVASGSLYTAASILKCLEEEA
ncbi:Dihydrofolate synthase/folylpolyglutamate synthase [subsurface metagenome]